MHSRCTVQTYDCLGWACIDPRDLDWIWQYTVSSSCLCSCLFSQLLLQLPYSANSARQSWTDMDAECWVTGGHGLALLTLVSSALNWKSKRTAILDQFASCWHKRDWIRKNSLISKNEKIFYILIVKKTVVVRKIHLEKRWKTPYHLFHV